MSDMQLAHEGYELKFADLKFGAGFPAQWGPKDDGLGGPQVTDAGTLHFTVSNDYEELYEDGVTVSVTLREMVSDMVDGCRGRDEKLVSGEYAEYLSKIVAAMREAADWMDAQLECVSAKTSPPMVNNVELSDSMRKESGANPHEA